MRRYLLATILLLIAGCSGSREYEITKNPNCVYDPNSFRVIEIPDQKLDVKTCLSANFCNPGDVAFVKNLPNDVSAEASKFIDSRRLGQGEIFAARAVGDFILIFVHEPKVADGGFEFVYSKKTKKVVGFFINGYRG